MLMLWVKTLHIVLIASWFAGLFYLPRIFVNMAQQSDPAILAVLDGMAKRLYRFMTILAVPAVLLGIWLYLGFGIGLGPGNGWMHAKLVLVLAALGYHYSCSVLLRKFEQGANRHSHVFYRWFNEAPVLILTAATALVVIKPF